jgi:hypothetical protein
MWNMEIVQIQQYYEEQVTYKRGRVKEGFGCYINVHGNVTMKHSLKQKYHFLKQKQRIGRENKSCLGCE